MYVYRATQSVVAYVVGDVTGDKIPDQVYLTGTKTPDSPLIQQITLHVLDGRSGKITSVSLPENGGYNPTIFLGDFTGDGVADILISIPTGGSGGIINHFLYSFINNNPKILFNSNVYNEEYKYRVLYQNDYKVKVTSEKNHQMYVIDISMRDPEYLNEIYDASGKLKSPITGFVNPLSGLYPVDFDSNHVFELLAYQKIAGRYNADALGYVLNTLGWEKNRFNLQNQYVAIFGA